MVLGKTYKLKESCDSDIYWEHGYFPSDDATFTVVYETIFTGSVRVQPSDDVTEQYISSREMKFFKKVKSGSQ